jgi:hypothetical protein
MKLQSPYSGIHAALGACVAVLVLGTAICQRWAPETGQLRLTELDEASPAC